MTRREAERLAWVVGGVGLVATADRLGRRTVSLPSCMARRRDGLDGLAARLHGTASDPCIDRRTMG